MCGRRACGINCFDAYVQVHSGFGVCRDTYIRSVCGLVTIKEMGS